MEYTGTLTPRHQTIKRKRRSSLTIKARTVIKILISKIKAKNLLIKRR